METTGPSFLDVKLGAFIARHPHAKVSMDGKTISVAKPWDSDFCKLTLQSDAQDVIDALNKVTLLPMFDAIIHPDKRLIELPFRYVDPKTSAFVNRAFDFHFDGLTFKCSFEKPTPRLEHIAASYHIGPANYETRTMTQLIQFRDGQAVDGLDEGKKDYFKGKSGLCFHIKYPKTWNCDQETFRLFARHLNFYTRYYDNQAPIIVVHHRETEPSPTLKRLRYVDGVFPKAMVSKRVDDVILQLIQEASTVSPRYSFLYAYQVIEYAGYYYFDAKLKQSLAGILRNPRIVECSDEHLGDLMDAFTDRPQKDETRMKKLIEECCDARVIWGEIEASKDFFASPQTYEGGFTQAALITDKTTFDNWGANWASSLFEHIERVRNCLVHARERRENKVILPTDANDMKVNMYRPLMLRIASQIALNS